jgi:hypothetical protein
VVLIWCAGVKPRHIVRFSDAVMDLMDSAAAEWWASLLLPPVG